jgi:hypothetical protein
MKKLTLPIVTLIVFLIASIMASNFMDGGNSSHLSEKQIIWALSQWNEKTPIKLDEVTHVVSIRYENQNAVYFKEIQQDYYHEIGADLYLVKKLIETQTTPALCEDAMKFLKSGVSIIHKYNYPDGTFLFETVVTLDHCKSIGILSIQNILNFYETNLNPTLPAKIDTDTIFENVFYRDNALFLEYRFLDILKSEIDIEDIRLHLKNWNCSDQSLALIDKKGGIIRRVIYDRMNEKIISVSTDLKDCV